MKKIIVAIDGYSSCGKSTIARRLAEAVGYTYVDTGAMYRAVALYLVQNNINDCDIISSLPQIHISFCSTPDGQHVCLNGKDVEKDIRSLEIGNKASQISSILEVRQYLVAMQQAMGVAKGIVMDGRDIGTVVFPDAELKLFLTASPEIRAKRRFDELLSKGQNPVMEDVLADINLRDWRDTHRKESPLVKAADAVVIDNSLLSRDEQMERAMDYFNQAIRK